MSLKSCTVVPTAKIGFHQQVVIKFTRIVVFPFMAALACYYQCVNKILPEIFQLVMAIFLVTAFSAYTSACQPSIFGHCFFFFYVLMYY